MAGVGAGVDVDIDVDPPRDEVDRDVECAEGDSTMGEEAEAMTTPDEETASRPFLFLGRILSLSSLLALNWCVLGRALQSLEETSANRSGLLGMDRAAPSAGARIPGEKAIAWR